MLNNVAVEHVHADVIGELKLELEGFPGVKVPGFLHRFVGVTRPAISTDALLRHVVNVHGMRLSRRVGKDPLLSSAKDGPGVDAIWIEPQAVNRPVARRLVKAPVARHRGLADIWQRAQHWRDRAVVDEVLSDTELKQRYTREQIREIDVLS